MENSIDKTENMLKKELKNARGKRELEKAYLEYVITLIDIIDKNVEFKDKLLKHMAIDDDELISYLAGTAPANITFYDEALTYALKKTKKDSNLVSQKGI